MKRRTFATLAGGLAATWSVPVNAQPKTYKVGFLLLEAGSSAAQFTGPLHDLGYVEGKNLIVEQRSADGDPARLAALAAELVQTQPAVLVAGWGTLAPKALKTATTTLPIVFSTVGDPVGAGLVETLARPGGNLTGLSGQSTEFKSKQLQLLLMFVPNQKVVGVLFNPDTPYNVFAAKELTAAAQKENIRLEFQEARKPGDVTAEALGSLVARGATSLFVLEDPLIAEVRDAVVGEATRLKLPVTTGLREYAVAGALIVYGASQSDRYRQTAVYIDKILKGAKPADLPVEQPTKFELVINQKAAKALGLTVPASMLALADDVIE